jgi:hypothetical protein
MMFAVESDGQLFIAPMFVDAAIMAAGRSKLKSYRVKNLGSGREAIVAAPDGGTACSRLCAVLQKGGQPVNGGFEFQLHNEGN